MRTVLIVDDSTTMRNLLSFSLRRISDLAYLEAENGSHALQVLRECKIDIILLDLNMPVMSGFTFLELMNEEFEEEKRPPVVVITTEGERDDFERAQQLGVKAYVTKPVQAPRLATTIEAVLSATAERRKP